MKRKSTEEEKIFANGIDQTHKQLLQPNTVKQASQLKNGQRPE